MPSGQPRTLTFTEYLAQAAPAELRQELTNGIPITMPPESDDNIALTLGLAEKLKEVVDWHLIRTHSTTLQVPSLPEIPQENRFPNLIVLTPELSRQFRDKNSAITLEMLNPALVVEVVNPYNSPNEDNYRCDYIEKRQQYEQRGVPEYWIVDPTAGEVTVLALLHQDGYQARAFQGQQRIRSSGFPSLILTVDELLTLGAK
ncbi:Uma2 family endonuclease [Nodosilinea sp. LEGE 07298]|uniref:Uma2 family endonuclease n=1 Tax=Nodosilinea sp. LEGE 07298 TaxID=2777970 RepID=UPI00187FC978|nr:Uma2 family endonuclease [Nodosilinea sp. LEGE 07298]MBE9113915.1 Uma2 family endonuclease [Nodosilinea sp. LEGE 07298]